MTVLDHTALAALARDLDDDLLVRQVVQLFLDQLHDRQRAVAEAVEAKDAVRVRREAHTLGSASAMVGAVELLRASRRLESSELGAATLLTDPLLVAWWTSCAETESAVEAWLAQP